MSFNYLIFEKLHYVFQRNNLHVIEQRQNYVKLQSPYLIIIISHNHLEKSNTIWLGRNDEKADKIEIDNQILSDFFQSSLRLNEVSTETFFNNLVFFFENEAKSLLDGDFRRLAELEEFDQRRSDYYTQALLKRQNLDIADNAWKSGNYEDFIKYVDKIGKEELPDSYKLKYEIAYRKRDG